MVLVVPRNAIDRTTSGRSLLGLIILLTISCALSHKFATSRAREWMLRWMVVTAITPVPATNYLIAEPSSVGFHPHRFLADALIGQVLI